ncbi:alpha-amylase family glycosyl hydrolase [Paenibacillus xerothermodurans]|uniref:Sucrose phosphorylase n=1 Tax=Paenibacillus xerothermodurans TaxID=1977292 RepID=A0A2W1NBX2_PAEXE|nr:alpha-amylase family glycosyl hydrolase [Paenibacillus xerothermodurans]PZE21150.1 alpha-amylase [Paenibacillus xerothermodurans]
MNKQQLLDGLREKMALVYGAVKAEQAYTALVQLVERWESADWQPAGKLTEKNVYLITYADAVTSPGEAPLATLHRFLTQHVGQAITDVHLLPMFPYTSDDGFSVTNYRMINPEYGDWEDIKRFASDYRLMFDFVANHISKSSDWFQGYLNDEERYAHYFIPRDKQFDASHVVRPRTSPLFHEYESRYESKSAWTTFSEDQVDVNFAHIPLLCEMSDILLDYAHRGASSIRLDAIGFLWKKSGTTCMHLPETHAIISVWRDLLDYFKSGTQIITETNVPHKENISYFGDGTNEANQVYQFSLPPLVLYAFTAQQASQLSDWAKGIGRVSDTATYFNFLASHDGIGMRPTEGLLSEDQRQLLVAKVVANGGRVSYKANPDGTQTVYELNINYIDALVNSDERDNEALIIQKALAAHSILCSVVGVPAIYYHSLFGSSNDYAGLEQSGIPRRINREKLDASALAAELETTGRRRMLFDGILRLFRVRQETSAFSPYADQQVVEVHDNRVFAVRRTNGQTGSSVVALANVTNQPVQLETNIHGRELFSSERISGTIALQPYGYAWIEETRGESNN